MYPPNYIQIRNDVENGWQLDERYRQVLVARNDYANGAKVNFTQAVNGRREYWEVDQTHPIYGKGKIWRLSHPFFGVNRFEVYWFWDMQRNNKYPGGNSIFGTKVQPYGTDCWYWTRGGVGYGNPNYYVMRGYVTFNSADGPGGEWSNVRNYSESHYVRYTINYKGVYLDNFVAPENTVFDK